METRKKQTNHHLIAHIARISSIFESRSKGRRKRRKSLCFVATTSVTHAIIPLMQLILHSIILFSYLAAINIIIIQCLSPQPASPHLTNNNNNHHQVTQDDLSTTKHTASFVEQISSDSVQQIAVGRPVKFKCEVNNIGHHKLAWFHKDKRLLLAIDNKTVAWKERIHVSSQANSVFFLQIDSVQLSDKVS